MYVERLLTTARQFKINSLRRPALVPLPLYTSSVPLAVEGNPVGVGINTGARKRWKSALRMSTVRAGLKLGFFTSFLMIPFRASALFRIFCWRKVRRSMSTPMPLVIICRLMRASCMSWR